MAVNLTKKDLESYKKHGKVHVGLTETQVRHHAKPHRHVIAAQRYPKFSIEKFDDKLTSTKKKWLREKIVNDRRKALKELDLFGIPNDLKFLKLFGKDHDESSDLGGRIMLYESPILKTFVPVNMNHRYRGMPPSCTSLATIDIFQLRDKETEANKIETKKQAAFKNPYSDLRRGALSKYHYHFLRDVAEAQLVTVPMSIILTAMEDVFPYYADLYNLYSYHFRETNKKSKEIIRLRSQVNDKIQLYSHL